MSFKPNKSVSDSDNREQESVDFIINLLKGTSTKVQIKKGDKEANIDGYIELLDEENCINGKLTVQVKTVSPSNEGKNSYPCPISLLGYAERTMDVVLLLAVDHSQNVVLWKYISRQLLSELKSKNKQQTITLHFKEEEKLSYSNIKETIATWNTLFIQEKKTYEKSQKNEDEINRLRKILVTAEVSKIDLPKSDIVKIQFFSDAYNSLLDNELLYVKQCRYPNSWKQGLAIFVYKENELLYSHYPINYGENSLLIKYLPQLSLEKIPFNYLSHWTFNQIKIDYKVLVKDQIKNDVKRFFKHHNVPPLYDYYIMEYLRDFVSWSMMYLNVSKSILNDYNKFRLFLLNKFAPNDKFPSMALIGDRTIQIELILDFVDFLLSRGYKGDSIPYPSMGRYGNSGFIYDSFNKETAFEKTKFVIDYVYNTYTDFISKHFFRIKKDLDMFYNADFILIDLSYDNSGISPSLCIHCFYYNDKSSSTSNAQIQYSLNRSNLLINNSNTIKKANSREHYNCIGSEINTDKGHMTCTISFGLSLKDVLFSKTSLIDTFRNIFEDRLTKYADNIKL